MAVYELQHLLIDPAAHSEAPQSPTGFVGFSHRRGRPGPKAGKYWESEEWT